MHKIFIVFFPVVEPSLKETWCLRRPYLLSHYLGLDYLSLNVSSRKKSAWDSIIVWFNLPHSLKFFHEWNFFFCGGGGEEWFF